MMALMAGARRLPAWLWAVMAAVLLIFAGVRWHEGRLRAALRAGATAQAAIDRAAFARAAADAAAAQARLVRELAGRQAVISKGTNDAVAREFADLERRYDDLRLRWAEAGAGAGGADADGAASISNAARAADDAACAARGWVDFKTASAAAQAADTAIAKDDAWIAWAAAQMAIEPY